MINIIVKKEMVLDELHIYGSSRHGIHKPSVTLVNKTYKLNNIDSATDSTQAHLSYKYFKRTLTFKHYELSNHLGNVLATVLDRKTFVGDDTLEYYQADVYTAGLYYAFGGGIEEMQYSSDTSSKYRYGFNNQEKDNELGEYYAFEYRIHDARLGRFLSLDPLSAKYPWYSSYQFGGNNPILSVDIEGLEESVTLNTTQKTHKTESGDTYSSLANKYNVTIEELRTWNGYKDNKIPIGVDLIVSAPKSTKKEKGDCETCKDQTLADGDWLSDVQEQVYYIEIPNVSQQDFNNFKANFLANPGYVTDNRLATYKLIDRDGDGIASVGDHIDIDISGPDNGTVRIDAVSVSGNSFAIKVVTLDGHPDAGFNYFIATYDEVNKTFLWATYNVSRTQVTGGSLGASALARELQVVQWKTVLENVWWIMYKYASVAGYHIQEYDWNNSEGKIGEKDGEPIIKDLTKHFQKGKKK